MSEDKKSEEINDVSRRDFFIKAGVLTTGFAVAGGIFSSLYPNVAEGAEAPAIPWKYAKLDINVVRKRGFDAYAEGG